MTVTLQGSCRCGVVSFSVESHAPSPYQLCYCSLCRKAGAGGYAINISAIAETLKVEGEPISAPTTPGGPFARSFCGGCGAMLWAADTRWPDLLHPFATAIDSDLPTPPERTHIMLGSKAPWVTPAIGPNDKSFDAYPDQSIEDWHRDRGLWID